MRPSPVILFILGAMLGVALLMIAVSILGGI
jgi:hypothetical protein